jgi:hypothetical protein
MVALGNVIQEVKSWDKTKEKENRYIGGCT